MHLTCKCEDFEEGAKQLFTQATFCEFHSAAPRYRFKFFKYCPWCSKELIDEDEEVK